MIFNMDFFLMITVMCEILNHFIDLCYLLLFLFFYLYPYFWSSFKKIIFGAVQFLGVLIHSGVSMYERAPTTSCAFLKCLLVIFFYFYISIYCHLCFNVPMYPCTAVVQFHVFYLCNFFLSIFLPCNAT